MIYLDSSAIVKMIRPEAESRELVEWLNRRHEPAVTSVLAEVEVPRMDAAVRATAGAYVTDALRSPDAVHLATAEVLVASGKTVSAFVTYDARQAGAVEPTGIRVEIPGRG